MRDAGDGVYVGGKLYALEEGLAAGHCAHIGYQRFAEGEEDVAVVVGVLENGIAPVGIEAPTGGVDDFVITVEGGGAGDEIENIPVFDLRFLICDFRGGRDLRSQI